MGSVFLQDMSSIVEYPTENRDVDIDLSPVLRPLYLFFRGRLSSQQSTSITAYSKDKMLPRGASRVSRPISFPSSIKLVYRLAVDYEQTSNNKIVSNDESNDWQIKSVSDGTTETAVSLEMGLAGLGKDLEHGSRPSFAVMS